MSDRDPVVYVVDDDNAVRHSLEWLLGDGDFDVVSFSSANEFLEKMDPTQPGCLVVDVRMPGMSGLELQRELKARAIDLPVIIITGHSDQNMARRALSAGAMDFLEKPLDDTMLLTLVRKALGKGSPEDAPSS
ncbi:MAG: response regulator [Rhodospirillales bacterium]|jgi:two-component system, LuxR family, response regulator FixJ|nr:response regulator [Rhodospirillales bacterium]